MRKFAYAITGAAALAFALAGAGAASASPALVHAPATSKPFVVVSSTTSENLAGYAGDDNGMKAFNDVRWNVVVPDEPATVTPDTIAVGGVLQEFSNVNSPTVGLGLVWDPFTSTGTCAGESSTANTDDQWVLEEGLDKTGAPGVPLPASALTPIKNASDYICVPAGQKYYMEIHDSTLFNEIAFAAGTIEPGNTLGFTGLTAFGPNVRFYNFGIGVDTTSGTDASSLQPGTLAAFTRDGITQLLAPSLKAGGTNDRLTINAENLQEYIGTQDGTSTGAPTLQPSGLSTGSAFSVSVES